LNFEFLGPFDCADKPAEKYCWLICCERKTLFRLKKQTESTDYKPDEQSLSWLVGERQVYYSTLVAGGRQVLAFLRSHDKNEHYL
jgi:hypothetical protein